MFLQSNQVLVLSCLNDGVHEAEGERYRLIRIPPATPTLLRKGLASSNPLYCVELTKTFIVLNSRLSKSSLLFTRVFFNIEDSSWGRGAGEGESGAELSFASAGEEAIPLIPERMGNAATKQ
jgi:hypothetical protein